MKTSLGRAVRGMGLFMAAPALALSGAVLVAQQPGSGGVEAQRDAMKKLAFLVGNWSGPVSIERGPGEPLKLTQTEHVRSRLDGLVLLIEGSSTGTGGQAQFEALATVSYDEAAHSYRIRAYNNGHYVDTRLTVLGDGFSWGFESGPAHVLNTMHLTARGQWQETTEVEMGGNPPHKSVEMLLEKRGTSD